MKKHQLFCRISFLYIFVFIAGNIFAQLPASAQETLDKGVIAGKLPDYLLAIKYFEDARKIAPDAPIIYFNLGLAESKIPGRELRAICWFAAYLAVSPDAPNKSAVLDEIKLLEVKNQSSFQRVIRAMEAGASSNTNYYEDTFWTDITRIWIKSGDMGNAIKAADQAPTAFYKNLAKMEIVDALIEKGELAQAETLATNLTGGRSIVKVMIGYAEDKIRANDFKAAQEILQTAANQPVTVDDYRERIRILSKIAELQSKANDGDGVKTTLGKLQSFYNEFAESIDPGGKGSYLVWIAAGEATAGDIAGARETLITAHRIADNIPIHDKKDIYSTDKKSDLLQAIAMQEAKNGDFDLALKTTEAITYDYYKYLALNEIAKFQAKGGDVAQAKKTIDLLKDYPKSTGLTIIATEQAIAGDRLGGLETMNFILSDQALVARFKQNKPETNEGNVQMLTGVAAVQVLAGDIPAARKTLAIAQKLCDRIPNNQAGGIHSENSNRKNAQYSIDLILGKIGRTDSPASVWVFYTEDSNLWDDAPLNSILFLDLTAHLKTLPQSNDPEIVFNALRDTAEKMAKAQTVILGLLKP